MINNRGSKSDSSSDNKKCHGLSLFNFFLLRKNPKLLCDLFATMLLYCGLPPPNSSDLDEALNRRQDNSHPLKNWKNKQLSQIEALKVIL